MLGSNTSDHPGPSPLMLNTTEFRTLIGPDVSALPWWFEPLSSLAWIIAIAS